MIKVWYLLSLATGDYLGPMSMEECQQAGKYILSAGIICAQAKSTAVCAIDGRPGFSRACPQFDIPQVTMKR